MRPPHHLISSQFFSFSAFADFVSALGSEIDRSELDEIQRLVKANLLPITSSTSLSVCLGVNKSLVWSLLNRTNRHYRTFSIPKGRSFRNIQAPRVALKIVQKWIGHYHSARITFLDHVFGFVPGRSHLDAAICHANADWAFSVDIEDFFPSTPIGMVEDALLSVGYGENAASIIAALCCLNGSLPQGSPASPFLSNLCFRMIDEQLIDVSSFFKCTLTRYADDIVFSGTGTFPTSIESVVDDIFRQGPWNLASAKRRIQPIKGRIKVHGLVVGGGKVRLSKGYRNKIRTYEHILKTKSSGLSRENNMKGHLKFSEHVNRKISQM